MGKLSIEIHGVNKLNSFILKILTRKIISNSHEFYLDLILRENWSEADKEKLEEIYEDWIEKGWLSIQKKDTNILTFAWVGEKNREIKWEQLVQRLIDYKLYENEGDLQFRERLIKDLKSKYVINQSSDTSPVGVGQKLHRRPFAEDVEYKHLYNPIIQSMIAANSKLLQSMLLADVLKIPNKANDDAAFLEINGVFFEDIIKVGLYSKHGYFEAGKVNFSTDNKKGDFSTNITRDKTFAFLCCLYAYQLWEKSGKPSVFNFVECAAAYGQLAKDIFWLLDIFSKNENWNSFYRVFQYHAIEISSSLCEKFKKRKSLSKYVDSKLFIHNKDAMKSETWDEISKVYGKFDMVISNELLDNLPFLELSLVKDNVYINIIVPFLEVDKCQEEERKFLEEQNLSIYRDKLKKLIKLENQNFPSHALNKTSFYNYVNKFGKTNALKFSVGKIAITEIPSYFHKLRENLNEIYGIKLDSPVAYANFGIGQIIKSYAPHIKKGGQVIHLDYGVIQLLEREDDGHNHMLRSNIDRYTSITNFWSSNLPDHFFVDITKNVIMDTVKLKGEQSGFITLRLDQQVDMIRQVDKNLAEEMLNLIPIMFLPSINFEKFVNPGVLWTNPNVTSTYKWLWQEKREESENMEIGRTSHRLSIGIP